MNMDERPLTQLNVSNLPGRIYDTGRICPKCGEHIFAFRMLFEGNLKEFAKPCPCRNAEVLAEDAEKEARMAAQNRKKRCAWSDVPDMFRSATLKGYRHVPGTEGAFESVKKYLLSREKNFRSGHGLILMGAVGCGKTHLGCAVLNCALENGYRAVYWNVPQQLEMLMPGNADDIDQMRILDKALLADVLLLDDLGAEKSTTWTQKELMIILDERYRENKPTIVTSNLMLTDDELRKTCGDRAYSRLCSDHFQAIALTAEDYRRKKV